MTFPLDGNPAMATTAACVCDWRGMNSPSQRPNRSERD